MIRHFFRKCFSIVPRISSQALTPVLQAGRPALSSSQQKVPKEVFQTTAGVPTGSELPIFLQAPRRDGDPAPSDDFGTSQGLDMENALRTE